MESDTAYFRRRAAEERAAADKGSGGKAREAHLEMASRFEELASGIEHRHNLLGLDQPLHSARALPH